MGWLSLEGAIYRAPTVLIISYISKGGILSKAAWNHGEKPGVCAEQEKSTGRYMNFTRMQGW